MLETAYFLTDIPVDIPVQRLREISMPVSVCRVLWLYRYFIAIYLVVLALGVWIGGMVTAWDGIASDAARFWAPLASTAGMMALCFAWGAGYGFKVLDVEEMDNSDLRPRGGSAVALILVTWVGFLFLLAWHGLPPGSPGQAVRAFIVFGTAGAMSFWWGMAAEEFGNRWAWLLPTALAVGWISGRLWSIRSYRIFQEIMLHPRDIIDLKAEGRSLLETGHIPIALLGALSLIGCWWFHKLAINRFTPVFFCLPMFIISWLGYGMQHSSGTMNFGLPKSNVPSALQDFFGTGSASNETQKHSPYDTSSGWASYLLTPPPELGDRVLSTIGTPAVSQLYLDSKPLAASMVNLSVAWREPKNAATFSQLDVTVSGRLNEIKGTIRMVGRLPVRIRKICAALPPLLGGQFQVRGYNVLVHPLQEGSRESPKQCYLPMEWTAWQPLPMIQGNKDGWGEAPSLNSLDLSIWLRLENALMQRGTAIYSSSAQFYSSLQTHFQSSKLCTFRYSPSDPLLKNADLIITYPVAEIDIPFDWQFGTTMEK